MGFFSWRCAISNKSIPHDYEGKIHLILPNNKKISGYYDGYGDISENSIMHKVCKALNLEGEPWDKRGVGCRLTGKKYFFGEDFENYESILKDFDLTVNECLRQKLVEDLEGNYEKCMKNVKIVTDYALNNPPNTFKFIDIKRRLKDLKFEDLSTSPECEYQGFFYPDVFKNFPEDYRGEHYNG